MKLILQAWNGKLNNKGMTLVEIIISIALITIVLVFLFSLLITVNDINKESEVNSTYLVNKSLILKDIEEDLTKSNNITLKNCSISNTFYTNYESERGSNEANQCLQINYEGDVNPAYLAIYYYDKQKSYVISYIHGNKKSTRKLPKFENNNIIENSLKKDFEYNLSGVDNGFYTIKVPIIGPDNKDYSIIISYYGTVKIET